MSAGELEDIATPVEPAEVWARVKQLRNSGRAVEAIPLLEVLCARHPSDFRYALCVAELLVDRGRLGDAARFLDQARRIGAPDPKTAEVLDRLGLHHTLLLLEQARRHGELIETYHRTVGRTPSTVRKIEEWSPIVNRAGQALWREAGGRVGAQAASIIAEVRERGLAIRSFADIIGDMGLFADLQTVMRTTTDWTVPGKPHFFKAMAEEAASVWHPVMKAGLNPAMLEIANGFYGLFSRLVSANIVLTKTDTGVGRSRQGSEGWHRDPEDTPMFKAFIYLNDVLEIGHGPFQYVPASRPGGRYEFLMPRFGRGIYDPSYKTKPDWDQADQEIAPSDVITVLGRAGTMFFADTSAFHRGGYCTAQDRYMAAYVYQRPASQFPSYIKATPDPEATLAARMALWAP